MSLLPPPSLLPLSLSRLSLALCLSLSVSVSSGPSRPSARPVPASLGARARPSSATAAAARRHCCSGVQLATAAAACGPLLQQRRAVHAVHALDVAHRRQHAHRVAHHQPALRAAIRQRPPSGPRARLGGARNAVRGTSWRARSGFTAWRLSTVVKKRDAMPDAVSPCARAAAKCHPASRGGRCAELSAVRSGVAVWERQMRAKSGGRVAGATG